jgi:hypothetical protein
MSLATTQANCTKTVYKRHSMAVMVCCVRWYVIDHYHDTGPTSCTGSEVVMSCSQVDHVHIQRRIQMLRFEFHLVDLHDSFMIIMSDVDAPCCSSAVTEVTHS